MVQQWKSWNWLVLLVVVVGISNECELCHAFHAASPFLDAVQAPARRHIQLSQGSIYSAQASVDLDCDLAPNVSFEFMLLQRLQRNDTSPISFVGYAISKRSLGKQLLFVDFCTIDGGICQAMLRQEYYSGDCYAGFRRCLLKGTKFQVTGVAAPTRNPGNVVLLIQSLQLLGLPRQVQYIQAILEQLNEGTIPMDQVLSACPEEFQKIDSFLLPARLGDDGGSQDQRNTPKSWFKNVAKDLFRALPIDPYYPEAADQKALSSRGSFVVPSAPPEWQVVPPYLLGKTEPSTNDVSLPGGLRVVAYDSILEALQERDQSRSQRLTEIEFDSSPNATVSISGWVQNRRRFQDNITMISLVDDLILLSQDSSKIEIMDSQRLLCILHPDLVSSRIAGLYGNLAAVGSKVQVQGWLSTQDSAASSNSATGTTNLATGRQFFWIDSIRLVQSSSQSVTIRHLLDLLHDGQITLEEVATALLIIDNDDDEANTLPSMDATRRQWKANELAVRLQEATKEQSMRRVLDPRLLGILEKYSFLAQKHPVTATSLEEMDTYVATAPAARSMAPMRVGENITVQSRKGLAVSSLSLPVGMPGSKWQSKKRPQLAWMGEQIRTVLESHPDYRKRKLQILDIGGGKGSLAHYLGRSMMDHVHIHVVDICEGAIANGAMKAERLDLPVDFSLADASQDLNVEADVVVALHACGHLSDVALAHATQRQAGFVIVPCCFNSNPHLTIPTTKAEDLVSVSDWLQIPNDDWGALKLLAEVQGDIPLASQAIGVVCAVRAEAVQKKLDETEMNSDRSIAVSIQSFPIEFSTRNTVLIGKPC